MDKNLVANASVLINAKPAKVWEALTTPEMIRQYLFGTDTISDWKEGSTITYKGVWKGKKYEDHGKILKFEPDKLLRTTYWSSMSGTEDKPENYATVDYALTPQDEGTQLTITQDNNKTEESRTHSENNWNKVLKELKELVEKEGRREEA